MSGRFYFGRFLELNGLDIRQITVVDINAVDFVNSIAQGKVDAVVTYPPYIDQIKESLGDDAAAWPIQNRQPGYSLLVSRAGWTREHVELTERFFRSLVQAESYYMLHPEETKAIVQQKLGYDNATIAVQWSVSQFALSLDQSLIAAMEDEARWLINNNLAAVKTVPDFPVCIYGDGLKAVKPGAVNVMR